MTMKSVSIGIAIFIVLVFYLIFNQPILGISVAILSVITIKIIMNRYIDKDALHIRSSLRQANQKTVRIQEYGKKWRMWKIWLRIRYIRKINNQIILSIQSDPNRFSKADKFFSLYLDSSLNILEKYDMLVHQPVRSSEVQKSLRMTEQMLEDVIKGLEQQLAAVLEEDMMELEIEKEVIKQYTAR